MKVRIRLRSPSRNCTVNLSEENSKPTVTDLRNIVQETLQIHQFRLSLNLTDYLDEDGGGYLSDLGIVSGDLIHVISNESVTASTTQSHVSRIENGLENNVRNDASNDRELQGNSSGSNDMTASSDENNDVENYQDENGEVLLRDDEVNKYLNSPMLLRESTASEMPKSFVMLYERHLPRDVHEALCLAVHQLLIESGFRPVQAGPFNVHSLPDSWIMSDRPSGFQKLQYTCPQFPEYALTILCINLGGQLQVQGVTYPDVKPAKPTNILLKCSNYVRSLGANPVETYKHLSQLSAVFKDAITYPILGTLSTGEIPTLLKLPQEMKLKIFQYLGCPDLLRLSEVCKSLREISNDHSLWCRLYLVYFRVHNDGDLSINWKQLYKSKYVARKELRAMNRERYVLWTRPPAFHPIPAPGQPQVYPPGMIGGHYDLYPAFGGLFATGGARSLPRPRFDPIGPLPYPRFRPGRGGGLRDHNFGGMPYFL